MTQFVEVQALVGRRVRDSAGRNIGRIEAIRGERIGPHCVVHEYHLGTAAFLSRAGVLAGHLLGLGTGSEPLRVPWQQLDLTDPDAPRVRATIDELRAMQATLPPIDDEGPPPREVARD